MLISKLCLTYCDRIEPWFNIKYGQFGNYSFYFINKFKNFLDIPNHWISYWLSK